MSKPNTEWLFWALVGASIAGWIVFHFSALLACMGECYVDLGSVHGYPIAHLEFDDTRLNTWILAWSQHALLTPGVGLFNANAFYPAPAALAGSEHLLGQAILALPLQAFTDNAVFIYGSMLVASYAVLGFSTAFCVRWLVDSRAIALLASLVAMAMPWRAAELSHLQLLWACWFPLIFCLSLRLLLRQGSWRDSAVLSVVLTLQLLSSYYLAYMITFTLGMTALVVLVRQGIDGPSFAKLAPAALVPYGILGAVSIPYLSRASRGEILVTLDPDRPMAGDHLGNAINLLFPRLETFWQANISHEPTFLIPASILGLALLAGGWLRRQKIETTTQESERLLRIRMAFWALFLVCTLSLIMMLGSHIEINGRFFRLPAYWASSFLPGFSNLRAPHRWAIVIGTSAPLLAALGAYGIMRSWRIATPPMQHPTRWFVAVLLTLMVGLNIPWQKIPAVAAFEDSPHRIDLYEKLAELPFGPVLEIPWHLNSLRRNSEDTRYMLASTRHWRPILNGFTAHLPPSFFLLNRISQDLPEPPAVKRLTQLTDLRWVVVHWKTLPSSRLKAWKSLASSELREVFRNSEGAIFEVLQGGANGQWMPALVDGLPRSRSVSGLGRDDVRISSQKNGISSLKIRGAFHFMGFQPLYRPIELEIQNFEKETWPGLDVQSEGLVKLRYAFSDQKDQLIQTGTAFLDADIPPGASIVSPILGAPTHPGSYRLCVDLVQIRNGTPRALPFGPLEVDVQVAGKRSNGTNPLERLAQAYQEYRKKDLEENLSRCAKERADPSPPSAALFH
jgi:hypothetical protein